MSELDDQVSEIIMNAELRCKAGKSLRDLIEIIVDLNINDYGEPNNSDNNDNEYLNKQFHSENLLKKLIKKYKKEYKE